MNTNSAQNEIKIPGLHYEMEKLSSAEFPAEPEPKNRVMYAKAKAMVAPVIRFSWGMTKLALWVALAGAVVWGLLSVM
ncbi:patatin [Novimethylophilus kurashikiensis]|uniref:Patatin n=1 Tax=Novimethylophilus kurashikiensis TaxID=1825523 RepID=A0A2R5FCI6_9PROT|nr:hypothetical protein [Novimethylophilus kurashikiensis]GBG14421.1 patatin [Novimethylophilus kurashikiensis]